MPRKKRNHGLPEEVVAVLRSSPNLNLCREFRRMSAARFVEHLNEGKCEQCLAFFRQLDKEQQMMKFLRDNRN
jgi:GTP1/Obg family GTP-binding protein